MKAADIEGPHQHWRTYFNGPMDHAALLRIRGVGPARADLILRLYGSIDSFLTAEPTDVATRTNSLLGPNLARTIQQRCAEAGLFSDWSRLEARVDQERRLEEEPPAAGSLREALRQRWDGVVDWATKLQDLDPGRALGL